MNYPKPVMKLSELKRMGFSEEWLMEVYRLHHRRKIAWKGVAPNSPIQFDTEELEKFRRSQCG